MVKRIKNRSNRKKKNQKEDTTTVEEIDTTPANAEVTNQVQEEGDAVAPVSPLTARDQLKLEIKSNAAYTDDRFAEIAERFLLVLADHWQTILVLFAVIASVYGFIELNHHWVTEDHSSERATLVKANDQYQKAQWQNVQYLKKKAKWYQDNPEALTSPTFGDPPSNNIYKPSVDQFAQLKKKLTTEGAVALAQIGEAGALFDMAQTTAEYKAVAEKYLVVGQDKKVVPFVKALALQNAAVAFEKAAYRAQGDASKALWKKAGETWQSLADVDRDVFGLFAILQQANTQKKQGQKDLARKTLEELQRAYDTQLKDPKNRNWKQKIQRALAHL